MSFLLALICYNASLQINIVPHCKDWSIVCFDLADDLVPCRIKGAMSPNTHARANENKLEKDGPTFSSCVGDFGRLFLSV